METLGTFSIAKLEYHQLCGLNTETNAASGAPRVAQTQLSPRLQTPLREHARTSLNDPQDISQMHPLLKHRRLYPMHPTPGPSIGCSRGERADHLSNTARATYTSRWFARCFVATSHVEGRRKASRIKATHPDTIVICHNLSLSGPHRLRGGGLDESLRKCRAEEVVSRLILYLASPDRSWRNPTHLNSGRDQPQVGRNRPDFGRNGPQLGRTEQQSDDRVQIARMLKEQG